MKTVRLHWSRSDGWHGVEDKESLAQAQWLLYFGSLAALAESDCYHALRKAAPAALIMGCSTGGEINGNEVADDTVIAVAVTFETTRIEAFSTSVESDHYEAGKKNAQSYQAGHSIARALDKPGLVSIFLLSDGLHVNGTELVRGIFDHLAEHVIVTGGLAGDGAAFKTTEVGLDEPPATRRVAAVGFYGRDLDIGYASIGGWDVFGPERVITKSNGNVLYELDGTPALDLYRNYLADFFDRPGGALMFPLSIRPPGTPEENCIVRTVMEIDEARKCLIFGGDVPEGYTAKLMRGNMEHLIDGAARAATHASQHDGKSWDLAVLVSCIGRKLLMGQRISDETEAVAEALGRTPIIGFYSYGEICHHTFTRECNLHNQTMTVTLFAER